MKSSLAFLISMLCINLALAEPPASPSTKTQTAASELVHKELLAPLKKVESKRSRFSRAAPVQVQRRVRVLDAEALTDVRGKQFVRFAIDERRPWSGHSWQQDSVFGCAYLDEREVFVRRGQAYLPARSMLGDDEEERADVCRAAPESAAQVSSTALRPTTT
jgi:hypothetical protein